MSRNSSGTYSLPIGNPVVPGQVIEAVWANNTMNDVAEALTDSLSRTGKGGMAAPFRVVDGTATAPSMAFANETGSGMYRASAEDWYLTVAGLQILRLHKSGANVSGAFGVSGDVNVTGNLTVTGVIDGPLAAFPAGTRLMFAQAAAPTGWTQVADDSANNRMLRVVNTAGGGTAGTHSPILNNVVPSHTHGYSGNTGGQSADHAHYTSGTTQTMNQNWAHTHGVNDPGHAHSISWGQPPGFGPNVGSYGANTSSNTTTSGTGISIQATDINHTHNWGNWSGGVNSNHTHAFSGTTDNGSSQTSWTPRYIDMILCSKN